ncbi:unknown protein 1-like [Vicia villosa]|uniref:unknown protein 1-like n=1 Tax=Vicia villosa TaxID=3911 RepID=UPI00273BEDA9|nr:unknown protein 1-like [Vicia villosa]
MDSCSPNAEKKDCQVPATPEVVKENVDFELQSPLTLTVVRKQLNETTIHSGTKDVVLDSFADTRKNLNDSRSSVVRRLPFRADSPSDQDIFESLHENLFQFILSKQMEERVLTPMSNVEQDECKSPPPQLRFTGIAHTCPPAPRKLKHQPKVILMELCKKLEF